jgi:hypothetical protein
MPQTKDKTVLYATEEVAVSSKKAATTKNVEL